MLKAMKYEFLRRRSGLAALGALLVLLELGFLLGTALRRERLFVLSFMGLFFLAMFCVFYIFTSGVAGYSRDLREKSGYLVFLTPLSPYRILGAKLLMILVEGTVFFLLGVLLTLLDGVILVHLEGNSWSEILKALHLGLDLLGEKEGWTILANLGALLLMGFVFFYTVVTLIYLAISLSATALQNKRGQRPLSFLLFVALSIGLSTVLNHLPSVDGPWSSPLQALLAALPALAVSCLVSIAAFIASGLLLEKKISL